MEIMQKITELNREYRKKADLQKQVKHLTGSQFTRFDQLFLRKIYMKRLKGLMQNEVKKMNDQSRKLTDKQQGTIYRQL